MVANGFVETPWMVAGGAHSEKAGRRLAYAAFAGGEGIVGPLDCKVSPTTPTADSFVHIATGGVAILNRATGSVAEAYAGAATAVSDIQIPPTSGAARSDLIVARVEDPAFNGQYSWPAGQSDPANGPFIFPRRIANVSPATRTALELGLGYPMIALARIDMPTTASTVGAGSGSSGTIVDLRQLAHAHWASVDKVQVGVGNGSGGPEMMLYTDTSYKNWPSNVLNVDIPPWATTCQVGITLNNLAVDGPADINTRVQLGGLFGDADVSLLDYNGNAGTTAGFIEHITHATYAEFDVRSLAGKNVPCRLNAKRLAVGSTGNVGFGTWEQIIFALRFSEKPL